MQAEAMRKATSSDVDEQIFEMQVRICKAFANSTRLRILDMLAKREHAISDIQSELGLSAPNVSQHLAILKAAGVVTTRRKGKHILCSLTIPEVKQACGLIREVLRAQIRNERKLAV